MTRRVVLTVVMVLALFATMTGAASATKPPADGADPADGHKITICHATNSLTNPYVVIEIDVASWNDPSDPKHHGDHHTSTKGGFTWSDDLWDEKEGCPPVGPPDPEKAYCGGTEVDIVVDFDGRKLLSNEYLGTPRLTLTESNLDIPAGTYSVVLGSSDNPHDPPAQDHEQWRAVFGRTIYSEYSEDLPDDGTYTPGLVRTSSGGIVQLLTNVTSITAEHWDVDQRSTTPDSVVPVCVGLIEKPK